MYDNWGSSRCKWLFEDTENLPHVKHNLRMQLLEDSDLTFNVNICWFVYSFKDKSLRTDNVNQTAQSTVKSSNFQLFGHNVPINCPVLLCVRRRNEALAHRLGGIIHVSMCRIDKVTWGVGVNFYAVWDTNELGVGYVWHVHMVHT